MFLSWTFNSNLLPTLFRLYVSTNSLKTCIFYFMCIYIFLDFVKKSKQKTYRHNIVQSANNKVWQIAIRVHILIRNIFNRKSSQSDRRIRHKKSNTQYQKCNMEKETVLCIICLAWQIFGWKISLERIVQHDLKLFAFFCWVCVWVIFTP